MKETKALLVADAVERAFVQTIEHTTPRKWGRLTWRNFDKLPKSARGRLLQLALRRCVEIGHVPPMDLVARCGEFLAAPAGKRNSPRDMDKVRKAARFSARNPGASVGQIAKEAEVSKETAWLWRNSAIGEFDQVTVHTSEYAKSLQDEQALLRLGFITFD